MHDRHGHPLKVGDHVKIDGTIRSISGTPDTQYCNIIVVADVPMAGGEFSVSLNAGQVELTESAPVVDAAQTEVEL